MLQKVSKKLSKSAVAEVSQTVQSTNFQELATIVLEKVATLPQLQLFPERRVLIDVIKNEHEDTFVSLVEALGCQYSTLYGSFKGKDAYLDLQINWYDYVRSLAADVEIQSLEDAQVELSLSPGTSEWLTIVTAALCKEDISKATQFAMLHEFARLVYLKQHATVLEEAQGMTAGSSKETTTSSDSLIDPVPCRIEANPLEPLIRMCGSQLQRMHTVTTTEIKRLKPSSHKYTNLNEQLQVIEALSMTEADKNEEIKTLLPSTDRGRMRFPKRVLYPFLQRFDTFVQQELNYGSFQKHGKELFQVCVYTITLYCIGVNCNNCY